MPSDQHSINSSDCEFSSPENKKVVFNYLYDSKNFLSSRSPKQMSLFEGQYSSNQSPSVHWKFTNKIHQLRKEQERIKRQINKKRAAENEWNEKFQREIRKIQNIEQRLKQEIEKYIQKHKAGKRLPSQFNVELLTEAQDKFQSQTNFFHHKSQSIANQNLYTKKLQQYNLNKKLGKRSGSLSKNLPNIVYQNRSPMQQKQGKILPSHFHKRFPTMTNSDIDVHNRFIQKVPQKSARQSSRTIFKSIQNLESSQIKGQQSMKTLPHRKVYQAILPPQNYGGNKNQKQELRQKKTHRDFILSFYNRNKSPLTGAGKFKIGLHKKMVEKVKNIPISAALHQKKLLDQVQGVKDYGYNVIAGTLKHKSRLVQARSKLNSIGSNRSAINLNHHYHHPLKINENAIAIASQSNNHLSQLCHSSRQIVDQVLKYPGNKKLQESVSLGGKANRKSSINSLNNDLTKSMLYRNVVSAVANYCPDMQNNTVQQQNLTPQPKPNPKYNFIEHGGEVINGGSKATTTSKKCLKYFIRRQFHEKKEQNYNSQINSFDD